MARIEPAYMDEPFRPQFHYTAEKNMINDPNGLVFLDGEFHLFHQYNLHEAIHWGHAVSADLVHWQHLPPAVLPDSNGQVYSGTAVVDIRNSSGLRTGDTPLLVAAFTHAGHEGGTQSQGIAYSNDRGRTWTMHPRNPVLPNPGRKDFRDPKILWHEHTQNWVMVLTVGTHLELYTSPDLIRWTHSSSWGQHDGSHAGTWECPDLFEVPIEGETGTAWVISVSVDRGAPAGGSGMQYFIGDFDGKQFVNRNPGTTLWQNWGKDYYAGITWSNVPAADGRTLMIAWADNWLYRFDPPTTPFNGQLSLVRELRIRRFPEGLRLVQNPVREQERLRGDPFTWADTTIEPGNDLLADVRGEAFEILAEFDLARSEAVEFGFDVRVGPEEYTRIGYSTRARRAYVDRNASGLGPSPHWNGRHTAPIEPEDGTVRLRAFVDRSSVEMFVNEREQITDLILPSHRSRGLRAVALGGSAHLRSLAVYPLTRIWHSGPAPRWQNVSGEWANTVLGRQGSAPSRTETGISLDPQVHDDARVSAAIEIIGAVNGNPRPILGERKAGLLLRADHDGKRGYLAELDLQEQRVTLTKRDPAGPIRLAAVSHPLLTNTPYTLSAVAHGLDLVVSLDGTPVLSANDPSFPRGSCGLAVTDAEAIFTEVSIASAADSQQAEPVE